MEDYCQTLGTNLNAIIYNISGKKRTEEEIDKFLEEVYNNRLRQIKIAREVAEKRGDQNKLEQLEKEEQKVELAYQKISTESLRNQLNYTEQNNSKKQVPKKQTAYEILHIFEEKLEELSEEEKDQYIKERRDKLLEFCTRDLERAKKFSEEQKIELNMKRIEEAYEKVSTAEKRKNYAEERKREEENVNEKVKAKTIEEKYSHADEYKSYLINNTSNSDNKMVRREEVVSREYAYDDRENRQLRIRRTADVKFQNATGVGELSISEYEVKRIIDGQEKEDIVYTDVPIIYLSKDPKTREPIYPDYYDCFVNKLLAEDTIEGSKYNGGFIGGIEQDEKGNYYITIEKERLSPKEQEQLTAVMMIKQREENIKGEGEENII